MISTREEFVIANVPPFIALSSLLPSIAFVALLLPLVVF